MCDVHPQTFLVCWTLQGSRECAREKFTPFKTLLSNKAQPLELSARELSWYVEGYFNEWMFNLLYYAGFVYTY